MYGPLSPYPGFSTPAMDAIWTAGRVVEAMLEFEVALALGLADAGLGPPEAMAAVAEACRAPVAAPDQILASTWEKGTPLLALLDEVKGRLPNEEERAWVHHGTTSQDAIDTAHMLLARSALDVLEGSLTRISKSLLALTDAHRAQPHLGRTFLQSARPTTFGRRTAGWLETTLHHVDRLRRARRELPVQLGGPAGHLQFGAAGGRVVEAVAGRLGLVAPDLPWHADRTPIWSLVEAVAATVRSMAKISTDLALLASSDVAEIGLRGGGSSSMPEKNNPIDPIRALAAASVCRGAVATITGAAPHELDRALGSWHSEWYALPVVFASAAATLEAVDDALDSIEVHADAMGSRVPPDQSPAVDHAIDRVTELFDETLGGRE